YDRQRQVRGQRLLQAHPRRARTHHDRHLPVASRWGALRGRRQQHGSHARHHVLGQHSRHPVR
ncbi:unnamed protein product, partial [Ectocarpus sp. 8 AP-2014]